MLLGHHRARRKDHPTPRLWDEQRSPRRRRAAGIGDVEERDWAAYIAVCSYESPLEGASLKHLVWLRGTTTSVLVQRFGSAALHRKQQCPMAGLTPTFPSQ